MILKVEVAQYYYKSAFFATTLVKMNSMIEQRQSSSFLPSTGG